MEKKDIETIRGLLEVMNELSFANAPVPKAAMAIQKLQAVAKLLHKLDNPAPKEEMVEQVKKASKKRKRKAKPEKKAE
jgi:hypothetical protein